MEEESCRVGLGDIFSLSKKRL